MVIDFRSSLLPFFDENSEIIFTSIDSDFGNPKLLPNVHWKSAGVSTHDRVSSVALNDDDRPWNRQLDWGAAATAMTRKKGIIDEIWQEAGRPFSTQKRE